MLVAEVWLCESYTRDSFGQISTRMLSCLWRNALNASTTLTCIGSPPTISNPSIRLGPSLFWGWTSWAQCLRP
ncbi:hypothetical protein AXF42_Ash003761 [Apostasia shenzhenica]|uniref:Uncharacterized protein n=1 Tax=Apostasia shenzhenica TaxID=1088818 RepID=A0A2I0AHT9_9ASPA|nr:hypothetical protein AXF42_Ash003761 [Apostasia shenzhenica]